MKQSKLFFGLASVLFLATTACTPSNTSTGPVKSAEEKVQEAYDSLVYTGLTSVTSNIDLITSVVDLEDVAITYAAAADQDYITISEDGKKALVTRPSYETGDVMLTPGFTATISLDGVSKTKNFNVKIIAEAFDDGWSLEKEPEIGKTYKLGMEIASGKVYFTGEMNGYYGATTPTGYYGVDVKVEDAGDSQYYITFDKAGVKKYIDVQKSADGAHTNFIIADAAGIKFAYDTEHYTFKATLSDGDYYLGTYGSYSTFGTGTWDKVAESYSAHLYYDNGNVQIPNDPVEMTIAEALEASVGTKVILNGKVKSVEEWSEQYGNMNFTMTDGTGDMYVFRSKTKVVVGDEVKVSGEIGEYQGNKQIAQGATVEVTEKAPEEGTERFKIDFNAYGSLWVGKDANTTESTFTYGGIEFGYTQMRASGYDGSNFLMFQKSQTSFLYNKTAFPGKILSVEFVIPSGSSGTAVYYADLFTSAKAEALTTSEHSQTGAGSFIVTAEESEGKTFFNISNDSTTTKNGQLKEIIITYVGDPIEAEAPKAPEAKEMTIAEALAAADNTAVKVKGTVKNAEEWSTQYNSNSFTLTDGTNDIYVFSAPTKVNNGDEVEVEGTISTYQGSKQIAKGAKVTVTKAAEGTTPSEPEQPEEPEQPAEIPAGTYVPANVFEGVTGSGYAAHDGEHQVGDATVVTSNVMATTKYEKSCFQFKKNSGTFTVKNATTTSVTVKFVNSYDYAAETLTISVNGEAQELPTVDSVNAARVDTGVQASGYPVYEYTITVTLPAAVTGDVVISNLNVTTLYATSIVLA